MEQKIIKILSEVKHPEINSSLVGLEMIGKIKNQGKSLEVEIKIPFPEIPIKPLLEDLVKKALKDQCEVSVFFSTMSVPERTNFMQLARENWAI